MSGIPCSANSFSASRGPSSDALSFTTRPEKVGRHRTGVVERSEPALAGKRQRLPAPRRERVSIRIRLHALNQVGRVHGKIQGVPPAWSVS